MIEVHKFLHNMNLVYELTTPQDANKKLVLQVYLGSNPLEFSTTKAFLVGFSKAKFTAI